ncbi:protein DEK-like [Hippoglossus hippoglossus]|uniref:protein DEK-like n=1 Tax=Hippoglossus hippoglossus TaxID=8267 RepID=UPI00148D6824|nr:protein DEK-like [Hippoglossus hippoglossus]
MSEVVEEAVDSSAVSEEQVEDQQETSQEELSSVNMSRVKASVVGDIIEGKRPKKTFERFNFQAPKEMEKLKIEDGSGDKLGDIPRTSFQLTKMKPADLKPLHAILFDRLGKIATIKKNLRLFNGFGFDGDSEQYIKKRDKLRTNSNFNNKKLKVVCGVLDLKKNGAYMDLVDRIMTFLIAPKNSGKRRPAKKKRTSERKLSGDNSKTPTKKKSKSKPMSSSSPKKFKAMLIYSSSDEDDEEEDEKVGASAEAEGSDMEEKLSEKEEDQSDKSEHSADEEEEEDYDVRFSDPSTELECLCSDPLGNPKKKKPAVVKPAAKTKNADSSSNRKNNTNTADDSSDDDEPLIKMIKKAPTDGQLKDTVQSLLKEANLEEMTMKQICQRVFDSFPDHDLSSKKDYIKQTVKSLIT